MRLIGSNVYANKIGSRVRVWSEIRYGILGQVPNRVGKITYFGLVFRSVPYMHPHPNFRGVPQAIGPYEFAFL